MNKFVNNKGQALIEFVLILPLFLLLILSIFDVGNMVISKINLENDLNFIIELYEKNDMYKIDEYTKSKKIIFFVREMSPSEIVISKEISVITPGLNLFTGNKYIVKTSRTIYE